MRIAVVGAGISGVAAMYELERLRCAGADVEAVLFESSTRIGGIVETAHETVSGVGDFTVELGPDGWVSEKPWARELAVELGLENQLVPSNDAERRTLLLRDGALLPMPENMRMLVPTDIAALEGSPLLSAQALAAYCGEPARAGELLRLAAARGSADVTVAEFFRDHFGEEVTRTLAAPLLAGIFGGDIERLSALSVMPAFLRMEREHGSLIVALQVEAEKRRAGSSAPLRNDNPKSVFSTLRGGLDQLIHAMAATLPTSSIHCEEQVLSVRRYMGDWVVRTHDCEHIFDQVILATPAHMTRMLLRQLDDELATLHSIPASSAIVAALLYGERVPLPKGFGLLAAQPGSGAHPALLAATFLHRKYPHSTPSGAMTLRVFFGGANVSMLDGVPDVEVAALAAAELLRLFPAMLEPARTIVRRWPNSMPQYEVGHEARVARIFELAAHHPGLHLVGNTYCGVGLPDLIHNARGTARNAVQAD